MAGFEVVVRPVILPNIRPARAQTLPPVDDPTKGICEIKGTSPHLVTFSFSINVSSSEQRPKETQRRSDTVRVHQKGGSGDSAGAESFAAARGSPSASLRAGGSDSVNRENFIDIQVANKIWTDVGMSFYKRVEEADNIEIIKRDEIIKNK